MYIKVYERSCLASSAVPNHAVISSCIRPCLWLQRYHDVEFRQEIVIDGFKSYAQRTVVSGFDPLFNAITGLNGSGKSNILDAICFVLGISNLSQVCYSFSYIFFFPRLSTFHCNSKVRAGSLQDLVYKQGQAGVSKLDCIRLQRSANSW